MYLVVLLTGELLLSMETWLFVSANFSRFRCVTYGRVGLQAGLWGHHDLLLLCRED